MSRFSPDECGVCVRCKEWTSLIEPCCSSGVLFEGLVRFYDEEDE
jgi:hypothetical protein